MGHDLHRREALKRMTLVDMVLEIDRSPYDIRDEDIDFLENLLRYIDPWVKGVATAMPEFSQEQEDWVWSMWERYQRKEHV